MSTRAEILKKKFGIICVDESGQNDFFNWDDPENPVPVFQSQADVLDDLSAAIRIIERLTGEMGGHIANETFEMAASENGYTAGFTLRFNFHAPRLREYIAQFRQQDRGKD